ncbi:hypothetical protein IQ07DRAFT_585105 [Pyrenochaeta sp. DS3sAY3a]|nr:hypothetical protein IQ07DRAFT_585105 [Pyrenochaeta sp. DS3sAY3a]
MADDAPPVPAPKKRSLFKRAAWQDAATDETGDMFSHANEFQDIVAEQARRRQEEEQAAERERQRRQEARREKKRRKVSTEAHEAPVAGLARSRSRSVPSIARNKTPPPPPHVPAHPPDSLAARYDSLARSALPDPGPVTITLDDDDDSDGGAHEHQIANRHSTYVDELEEVEDPVLAAMEAKARRKAQLASASADNTHLTKTPIIQLFISPEIPGANPLVVTVRIDSTIERPRQAWCQKQGYSVELARSIFFTWKGTRIYDSTTVKRLGIQVDKNGSISVDGDSNIYDDVNLPKIVVEAWTEELFQQRKKEDAAAVAAKKKAAETVAALDERDPTPEPEPAAKRWNLFLKAKGKEEFRLSVTQDNTFEYIAQTYKTKFKIGDGQPLTLMFDGERLSPLDCIADSDIEDQDCLEVLFK